MHKATIAYSIDILEKGKRWGDQHRMKDGAGIMAVWFQQVCNTTAWNLFVRGSVPTEFSRTCYAVVPQIGSRKLYRVM
jgi:hypothetical protein